MGNRIAHRIRTSTDLISHTICSHKLDGIKPKTQLPTRLGENMIICKANVETDNYIGKCILLQTPIEGMSAHDWQDPEHHGDVIDEGLISYDHCMKVNQCDCLFQVLENHLDNNLGLYNYGWRPIKNNRGQTTALMLVKA